jgi:hypothetical protein
VTRRIGGRWAATALTSALLLGALPWQAAAAPAIDAGGAAERARPTAQTRVSGSVAEFIQSVQYGIDSTFWFLWAQADYDKLGIQLNAGTPQTITAWNQTRSWLLNRTMEQCASGQGITACQMSGGSGNLLLLWTDEGTKQVNLGGLGSRVQQLDGSVSPVPASRVITVGIAPVAVLP